MRISDYFLNIDNPRINGILFNVFKMLKMYYDTNVFTYSYF